MRAPLTCNSVNRGKDATCPRDTRASSQTLAQLIFEHPPRRAAFSEGFGVRLVRARITGGLGLLRRQEGAVAEATSETPTHSTLGLTDLPNGWLLDGLIYRRL